MRTMNPTSEIQPTQHSVARAGEEQINPTFLDAGDKGESAQSRIRDQYLVSRPEKALTEVFVRLLVFVHHKDGGPTARGGHAARWRDSRCVVGASPTI